MMMRALVLCIYMASAVAFATPVFPLKPPAKANPVAPAKSASFDFRFIQVAQVIQVLYGEVLNVPYVLAPDVLDDKRIVSFRYDATKGDLRAFLAAFLDSLGMEVRTRSGVDFVLVKPKLDADKAGSPEAEKQVFVYRPKFRTVSYLATVLRPVFAHGVTVNRPVSSSDARGSGDAPVGSAAAMIDQNSDTFVFVGTRAEVVRLEALLPQLDTPVGEVAVRAVAYEVATSKDDGSAFQLALHLLGGRVGVQVGEAAQLPSSVRFATGAVDAVFSTLSGDSRFKVISAPNLRIRSGDKGRMTVGQKVPVLGAVTYPQGGSQPVQSVEYQSSGVIFELHPVVKESSIDITVMQQISDFVKTTTGVNNSPTLNTREVASSVSMSDGEMILLGGLTQDKSTDAASGPSFLPSLFRSSSTSTSNTEVLLFLQVSRVGAGKCSQNLCDK